MLCGDDSVKHVFRLGLLALSLVLFTRTVTASSGDWDIRVREPAQLSVELPERRSQRALVNDRRIFYSYRGQGALWLDLQQATSARILINGRELVLPTELSRQPMILSLAEYTRDGLNQLHLADVKPAGASIRLRFDYPRLREGSADEAGFSAKRLAELDALIEQEVAAGFPGAVLLIAKNGRVIKETAYGYAKRYDSSGQPLTQPEPMQTDTLFDIASNSKMYATVYAVMKLVTEGLLDVNAPIAQYLPEYRGDGRELRLVRDLLDHSAGYGPELHFFRPDNRLGADFYSIEPERTKQLLIERVPFERPRGHSAVYSDTGFMLLGALVERVAGMALDSYLEHGLYRPLGLSSTWFNPLQKGIPASRIAATELDGNTRGGVRQQFPAMRRGVLRGEVHDEKAFYSLAGVAGHAGLFSTARELAVLMMLAQHGGYGDVPVFSQPVIQQFVRPSSQDHRFGLGWRTAVGGDLDWHFGPYASRYAFGHTGWTGTATLIDPHYDLLVVLLTNKKHSPIARDGNSYYFTGDRFETGMYGSVMSLVYQAMLGL
ncbi:penicillin binding protein PBP4B [Alkalimonas sp. MEB108]|uniref:Penicillin binding protein PBP4B n=1 Tax=Alkalimonas cellulosilytica TaxID=3058395 RepID=A0ABU7J8B3_9GAMM|nr:penicillin binding protein PBP4B [Alkalimonas sp. MEB108]MEE2002785.1 penicillin binding protein PBP4B [Alkalimonas sp. MEB108]